MKIIAALLVCLAVKITYTVDLRHSKRISCPCGSERINVTVCIPDANVYEEVCASLLKCENCDEDVCSKCSGGLECSFCSQGRVRRAATDWITPMEAQDRNKALFMPIPDDSDFSILCGDGRSTWPVTNWIKPMDAQHGNKAPSMHFPDDLDFSISCGLKRSNTAADWIEFMDAQDRNTALFMHLPDDADFNIHCAVTALVFCEYPGDISNGRVLHITTLNETTELSGERKTSYPEGSKLQYSCNNGYLLEGQATLTCQINARWSAAPPTCNSNEVDGVYCPNPGTISNGQLKYYPAIISLWRPTPQPIKIDDSEFPLGSRLRYLCDRGYTLVGNTLLVCLESGSWSKDKPVCSKDTNRPVYCNYPGDLDNGQVLHIPSPNEMTRPVEEGEQYPARNRLRYSCDDGFTLEGPSVLNLH